MTSMRLPGYDAWKLKEPPVAAIVAECGRCGTDLYEGDEVYECDSDYFCSSECLLDYMERCGYVKSMSLELSDVVSTDWED